MRIAFVLPAPVRVPHGGALVVARHAKGLSERGHEVHILMPHSLGGLRSHVRGYAVRVWNRSQGVSAQTLSVPGVRVSEPAVLPELKCDAVIATGFQTALPVSQNSQGQGFYLVQGDERAMGEGVRDTWNLPLKRIAVSHWLAELIQQPVLGVVPNAVDHTVWSVDRHPSDREDRVIALYHRHPIKGPETLIQALRELRHLHPRVQADVFCARVPSHRFPSWIRVHVRPEASLLRRLYNQAAVCLHTSVVEGWGLVPMEAAACGCAVVATASRGPREYLQQGVSMSEVAVGDGRQLAREAARLLRNPDARDRQAQAALESVKRFTWDDSTDRLESLLVRGVG